MLNTNKYICINCGFVSRKGGQCWEKYGKCAKCCKEPKLVCACGNKSNHQSAECWRNGMCGTCWYAKKFPKKIIPQYDLCGCGERLVSLVYKKRGVNVRTLNKFCVKCQKAFMYDNHHITVLRGLCQLCYRSNMEITINEGLPICQECKDTLK